MNAPAQARHRYTMIPPAPRCTRTDTRAPMVRLQSVQLRLSEIEAERARLDAAFRAAKVAECEILAQVEQTERLEHCDTVPAPPPSGDSRGAE
jgi:hypothetical protein